MATETIYQTGEYLSATQTWHAEDSPWKARQIQEIVRRNQLALSTVAEIGCGAGVILHELSQMDEFAASRFIGYDVSPQAIELAAKHRSERIEFHQEDILSPYNQDFYDALLVIDVFEHVPDYLGFLERCQAKATFKIYHIPLGLHVSSVLRNVITHERYTIGHLHHFTADIALCALRDAGHEIIDTMYTNGAMGLFRQHPSIRKAIANVPRWLLSRLSVPLTARLLGGYSLLVLAK